MDVQLTAMVSSVMGGSQGMAESNFSAGTQSVISWSSLCGNANKISHTVLPKSRSSTISKGTAAV